jgi:hypothetical protein
VEHDLEVRGVHLVDHALGFREIFLLPSELAVARVPARRRERGAEIDQRIARQFLFSKRARDPADFIRAG